MKILHLKIFMIVLGQAIIIAGFLHFGEHSREKYLHMVVASVVYLLWLGQAFFQWLSPKDKSNREISSIGIQWYGIMLYTILAIALSLMILCNFVVISFAAQTIIHLVLLAILLTILILGKSAEDNSARIYEQETVLVAARDNIKNELNSLKRKLSAKADLPPWITERVAKMEDETRYISPNDIPQARHLDSVFIGSLKKVENAMDFGDLDQIKIDEYLKLCEDTLTERKKTFR